MQIRGYVVGIHHANRGEPCDKQSVATYLVPGTAESDHNDEKRKSNHQEETAAVRVLPLCPAI